MLSDGIDESVITVGPWSEIPQKIGQAADSTTFVAKSSMLGNIQKKPNAPKHRDGGPTKNLLPERKEASGKM